MTFLDTAVENQGVLERRYQGEHPLRTLWFLAANERWKFVFAFLLFVVKHSPVWLVSLLFLLLFLIRTPLLGLLLLVFC